MPIKDGSGITTIFVPIGFDCDSQHLDGGFTHQMGPGGKCLRALRALTEAIRMVFRASDSIGGRLFARSEKFARRVSTWGSRNLKSTHEFIEPLGADLKRRDLSDFGTRDLRNVGMGSK